jgi:O-antigen/teichoic acid export membrane protein
MIKLLQNEAFGIFKRIKNRDFTGNTGLAVKNSLFSFFSALVLKIGSLAFTIIIARMLMPELFGLYSLALSTIVFMTTFCDLGIGTVLISYVSRELAKKKSNAKAYIDYLFKVKMSLTLAVSLILLFSSYFLAKYYYNKPIFFALAVGSLYLAVSSFQGFYSAIFQAVNKFQYGIYKEIIFQVLRLVLIPLAILLTIKNSTEILLFAIILTLTICYLVSTVYLFFARPKFNFTKKIDKNEKIKIWKFILPLTTTVVSGIVFGYIDMIMLGRFVESEFIGYYSAALALIGSVGSLIGFSGAVFPIFARLGGAKLKLGLKRVLFFSIPISLAAIIGTLLLSKYVILIVYGVSYSPSINILRLLSVLLLVDPLIAIYSSYHISKFDQKFVAKTLIFATILNITLNYLFIQYALNISHYATVFAVSFAILISRFTYLILLARRN